MEYVLLLLHLLARVPKINRSIKITVNVKSSCQSTSTKANQVHELVSNQKYFWTNRIRALLTVQRASGFLLVTSHKVKSEVSDCLSFGSSVERNLKEKLKIQCYCATKLYRSYNMFKKFDEKESISGVQQLKSSVQKGIRARLLELYPHLENYIDQVLPKKDTFRIVKCHDHIEIMVNSAGELLFFRHREGPWMPTLRLLHKYPFFVPMQQVDKGAIRFVLSGANIMCPGLTSPGAKMSTIDKGQVVAVVAEGKTHALAVGMTALSTDDIAKVNKGVGVENCHYLNDGLWQMKPVK